MSDYDVRVREAMNNKVNIPTHYNGQEIPPKWHEELYEGKTIRMQEKTGNEPVHIRMNFVIGQAKYSKSHAEKISPEPLTRRHVATFKL